MPITASDAAPGAAMKAEITDYAKALEVVKTYKTRDGLDVDTLIDSDKHGALTYNDFLILPGYIGKPNPAIIYFFFTPMTNLYRFPRFRCLS
jgi:IMP dehydrogenase